MASFIRTAGARITRSSTFTTTRTTIASRSSLRSLTCFYGPESDFVEGQPKILQNATLNVDGLTKIFDNSKGGDPAPHRLH